jgi:rod shape determining protein RodA
MIKKFTGANSIDWITMSLYLTLVFLGMMMIYASTIIEFEKLSFFRSSAGKMATWFLLSVIAMGVVYMLDWKIWQVFAYPLYGITVALLVAVLLFGSEINGNKAWFLFMGLSFQPAEFAKFGTSLAISAYLSSPTTNLKNLRNQFTVFGLLLVPMFLIALQGDMGSALVFLSFMVAFYREGLTEAYYLVGFFLAGVLIFGLAFDPSYVAFALLGFGLWYLAKQHKNQEIPFRIAWGLIAIGFVCFWRPKLWGVLEEFWKKPELKNIPMIALGVMGAAFLGWMIYIWAKKGFKRIGLVTAAIVVGCALSISANIVVFKVLKPHQADRILVWLTPNECPDCKSAYNLNQSKYAISSGGILGKGFLRGTMTRMSYVPEQPSDFIFCTVGEEHGFVGSAALICLYLALLLRLTILAERQRSNFARIYAYCLAGILFFHFLLNIGMTMGLLPIVGIPLPFISRGGTSLMGFSVMIAVMLKMDHYRYRL